MDILKRGADGTVTIPSEILENAGFSDVSGVLITMHGTKITCMPLTGDELARGMEKELRGVMREKIAEEAEYEGERHVRGTCRGD